MTYTYLLIKHVFFLWIHGSTYSYISLLWKLIENFVLQTSIYVNDPRAP